MEERFICRPGCRLAAIAGRCMSGTRFSGTGIMTFKGGGARKCLVAWWRGRFSCTSRARVAILWTKARRRLPVMVFAWYGDGEGICPSLHWPRERPLLALGGFFYSRDGRGFAASALSASTSRAMSPTSWRAPVMSIILPAGCVAKRRAFIFASSSWSSREKPVRSMT